ncbi:unnamed protein product, partial [Hymenolepis diminuta]
CTCAHVLTSPYPSNLYKVIFVFHSIITHACLLPALTFPTHLLSSSACFPLYLSLTRLKLVVASLNTFRSNQLLVFCSTIVIGCKPLVVILTPTASEIMWHHIGS